MQMHYRKTRGGQWVVCGEADALTEGATVTVSKKDGSTSEETIGSVGKTFQIDGVAHRYGYIDKAAKREREAVEGGVTEPGMYRGSDGTIYKVQEGSSGHLYAKALVQINGKRLTDDGDVVRFEFQYAAGAVRSIRATDRLSLEEAKQFGLKYSVCCVCGTRLEDAKSVAAGIGPVCAKSFGSSVAA